MSRRPVAGRALTIAGLLLLALVVVPVLLAPWVAPYDPAEQLVATPYAGPSGAHWLGADRYGRDVGSRLLHGGRETLLSTGLTMLMVLLGGTLVGAAAAVAGRRVDRASRHVFDVVAAFPVVVVALAWVGLHGASLESVLLGVLLVMWAPFARLSRALVRAALTEPSAQLARATGAGPARLLWREVLPRVRGPVMVLAAVEAGQLIGVVAGLSFLGLGAQPPSAEWGAMLQDARAALWRAPHLAAAPGGAVLVTVLALTLVGEGLRDATSARAEAR